MAEYWTASGHDVRTIAIDLSNFSAVQSPSPKSVYYLPYDEPGRAITRLVTRLEHAKNAVAVAVADFSKTRIQDPRPTTAPGALQRIYREAIAFPDRYRAWIGPAVHLALSWQPQWSPDVIYSSGPPHSSHVVARRLAARLHRPWIAELRDLWAGNPYDTRHPLIEPVYRRAAKFVLSDADACVGVTKSACDAIKELTGNTVLLAYNGYDPEDFEHLDTVSPLDSTRLTILHAGVIYPGRRDPARLFAAIALLGEDRRKIRCLFYHDEDGVVAGLAQRFGIDDCVEIYEQVPRSEMLRLERQVDILLECRLEDPAGDGVIPGKLFEYIGARRPILSIGSLTGESADMIRNNGLGLVSKDPAEIAQMLKEALVHKMSDSRLPDIRIDDSARFHRKSQFQKVDALMGSILGRHPLLGVASDPEFVV